MNRLSTIAATFCLSSLSIFFSPSGYAQAGARLNSPVTAEEVTRAFIELREQGAEALTLSGQAENWAQSALIIQLTQEARLPLLHHLDGLAELGALIVQTPTSQREINRITSDYIARVLKGAQPADLPIFHTDRTLLHVNLNTARALGIALPESVLARADRIIE